MDNSIRELCGKHTLLAEEDIEALQRVGEQLPVIARLTGSDIFIDALTCNDRDAIVLAWASPASQSLYNTNIVGAYAYSYNEPAVYHTLKTGVPTREIRGVSQENIPIAQTVVPLFNKEKVIGVLIRERDISTDLQQEERVELLSQTAESLSNTLMYLSRTETSFEEWVSNGILVLNRDGIITYANKEAANYFKEYTGFEALGRSFSVLIPCCTTIEEIRDYLQTPVELSFLNKLYLIQSYSLLNNGELSGCTVSLQDITDLRKKEQELNLKSTIIHEIHHRVKNNLQNIAALLRLQMRRADSEVIKAEFADSINRIISIALVHDVFAHQTWDTIDLLTLSRKVMDSVLNTVAAPHDIVTRIEGNPVEVCSKQAVPLALVINELVTNSIKHGVGQDLKGKISILVRSRDGIVDICVCNSGSEPMEMENKSEDHLGLQIVKSLVEEQLGGQFNLERINGVTQARVSFPEYRLEDEG